jgi:hypothetical protein
MKWIVAVLCIFVFTLPASGQTTTYTTDLDGTNLLIPTVRSQLPNSLTAVAIDWHYDPQQQMLILHLVNNSGKDITAYDISITQKYAVGSTDPSFFDGSPVNPGERMEDMLGAVIQRELTKSDGPKLHGAAWSGPVGQKPGPVAGGNGTFAAGTTRDQMIPEPRDIPDVHAFVDVVVYADGTADVQNERAFRELAVMRKGQLQAMEKVTGVVKRVLADPMASDLTAEALRELAPLADAQGENHSPQDTEFYLRMNLRNDVKNLQMLQGLQIWSRTNMTERDWLIQYVEQDEKRIALMSPHCQLKRLD